MERWRKLIASAVALGSLGLLVAHGLSKAKDVYEAPGTVAQIWGFVRAMFDLTPGATLFLVICLVGLAVALWRPAYTERLRSLLLPATAARILHEEREGNLVANIPKNVFQQIGDNNRADNVHVGDVVHRAGRAVFTEAMGEELLGKIPKDKPVKMVIVGSEADQQVGRQMFQFLTQHGYAVEITMRTGALVPPPDGPFTFQLTEASTLITVAPSIPGG